MIEINKTYNENCTDTMARMPDDFIDLTVTSPPYDNLRDYKGYTFDFESIANELYRVTKQGGVVVWVVGDATINGSETGTSFKQALYFKEIGFNLHDTMIYEKANISFPDSVRYYSAFEYMFILSKGSVANFNPIQKPNPNAGKKITATKRGKDGALVRDSGYLNNKICPKMSTIRNIWRYANNDGEGSGDHPAIFPEKLSRDHIISWSNEGDLVYDPFMGSGTTGKMAREHGRNYIGSEISSEYCEIIKQRTSNVQPQLFL